MKLSIIVPVYNMAADGKLEYCLNSLLAQTVGGYEIIAVDDCSTDDSMVILRRYEAEHPGKFTAVHSPVNQRQGGAKNIGMKAAKGEWIGFIDSDDWVAPDMYEKLLQKAAETGADVVGCDYSITSEHSMKVGEVVANNLPEQSGILDDERYKSLILNWGSLVVKIYRREVIVDHALWFPEHIFYEDNAMGAIWMLHARQFAYLEEPLYYYYQHEASTVHMITEGRCEDRMQAARIMIHYAEKIGCKEKYFTEFEFRFTELFYVNTLFSYMAGVHPRKYAFVNEMRKEMREYFPDFQENPYYRERIGQEEQKLITMHMKSTVVFMGYYILLNTVRRWKKQLRKESR